MAKAKAGVKNKGERIAPPPKTDSDFVIADPVGVLNGKYLAGNDRLTFDGYSLTWHGSATKSWAAFSGADDEKSAENIQNIGPTPQGLFAVNPANAEVLKPTDAWGEHRVRLEPYAATVDRMRNCLKVVRTGMYIHGGNVRGTLGCIELNNDADENEFFTRLQAYGKPIELEVRYVGEREKRYEYAPCPYP